MYRVLIADDEKKIRETLGDYLKAKGFDVTLAKDGEEALVKAQDEAFDIIILDVLMPGLNGIETCKEIRAFSDTPIVFLSALGEEADLLKGFSAGADDYIVKPFPLSVLEQKCRQVIRRSKGATSNEMLTAGGIAINYAAKSITVDGAKIPAITGKDFALLAYLMENKNIVLDREKILAKVWGYGFDGDARVVDTHIKNIRKALGEKGSLIETIIGTGYVFRGE